MKELLEVMARSLVEHPEEVSITEAQKDGVTVLNLKVASSDMGKVIGKSGRIAKAMRQVINAAAAKDKLKVFVDIG